MKILKINFFLILLITLITSCSKNNPASDEQQHEHEESQSLEENEVHLSNDQIANIDLRTGGFSDLKMSDFIRATGVLDVPPNATASINAPEAGFVRDLKKYIVGSYLSKGTVLATLEHPKYLEKQQEYLEISSELIYLGQELERQRTLSEANAGAVKAYQKAQADYAVKQVRLTGLGQYLTYLGIDLAGLKNGKIVRQIPIVCPMNGYVTQVSVHNGMFAQPEMELYNLLNTDHIHLELDVFESDMNKVKVGQALTFTMAADAEKRIYKGSVHEISPTFDTEKKTMKVHAHIEGKLPKFIQGAFLEAKIWLNETTVKSLPETAVVRSGGQDFVFILSQKTIKEAHFKRIPVRIKQQENGWVALDFLEELPPNPTFVIKEAFYLMAEMTKGEHEHQH